MSKYQHIVGTNTENAMGLEKEIYDIVDAVADKAYKRAEKIQIAREIAAYVVLFTPWVVLFVMIAIRILAYFGIVH